MKGKEIEKRVSDQANEKVVMGRPRHQPGRTQQ